MSAQIKRHSTYKGITIYAAANTHPGSKTTSLIIFTEDIVTYTGKKRIVKFRYERYNPASHTEAACEAAKFINNLVK